MKGGKFWFGGDGGLGEEGGEGPGFGGFFGLPCRCNRTFRDQKTRQTPVWWVGCKSHYTEIA